MTETFALSAWAFVAAVVANMVAVGVVAIAVGWMGYRTNLQLAAENRRLTERLMTLSENQVAARSAVASLEARDNVPGKSVEQVGGLPANFEDLLNQG